MNGSLSLLGAAGLLWGAFSSSALPDPRVTPGAVDAHVTQANIQETICVPGYARSVRPPYSIMGRLKAQAMRRDHPGERFGEYEFDHLVALSIGGAPDDPRNLWLEPRLVRWSADAKDELEYALWVDVCNRGLPPATAPWPPAGSQRTNTGLWVSPRQRQPEVGGQPDTKARPDCNCSTTVAALTGGRPWRRRSCPRASGSELRWHQRLSR